MSSANRFMLKKCEEFLHCISPSHFLCKNGSGIAHTILTLLHSQPPKLHRVLAVQSAIRLKCKISLYTGVVSFEQLGPGPRLGHIQIKFD